MSPLARGCLGTRKELVERGALPNQFDGLFACPKDHARAAAASSKVTNFRVESVGFLSSALNGAGITALRFQVIAQCNTVCALRACGLKPTLGKTAVHRRGVTLMLSAVATADGMLLSMSATSITDESDPFWALSQLAHVLTGTGSCQSPGPCVGACT